MKLLPFAAAASILLWGLAAHADGEDLQGVLDQSIVTTASKSSQTTSSAPGMVTVISSDDLRRYGIRTLAEAIDFLSVGMMTADNLLTGEVGSRGVIRTGDNSDHVLLLINGHVMNEPFTGGAVFNRGAGIPIEFIDHLELIVGPGSVMYGTGAMLGVVNVITKKAEAYDGYHVVAESELLTSGRLQFGVGKSFTLFGRPAELTGVLEYYKKDGPTLTFPKQFYIDAQTGTPARFYRDRPADGIWGGDATRTNTMDVPAGHVRLTVGNFDLNVRGSMFRRGYMGIRTSFDEPEAYRNQYWWNADLSHRYAISNIVELTSRAYADWTDSLLRSFAHMLAPCQNALIYIPGVSCAYEAYGGSKWAGLEERATFDWQGTGKLVTMIGVDGRARFVAYKTDQVLEDGRIATPTYGGFSHVDFPFAVYAQQTWDPASWIGFNAGVRIDRDERFAIVPSPRAAVAVRPWEGNTIKVSASQAFRAPSWFETHAKSPVRILPDALRPEIVRTIEASTEQAFGTNRLLFGVFASDWRDMVSLQTLTQPEKEAAFQAGKTPLRYPTVVVQQFRNTDHLVNYGASLGFEGSQANARLRYGVSGTVSRAYNDTLNHPLTVGPPLFGNARVSYDLGGSLPTLGLASYYQSTRPLDVAYEAGFLPPPYAPPQLELRLSAVGPVPRVTGLSYRAMVSKALSDKAAYASGPTAVTSVDVARNALQPVETFRVTVGLQYDF
jgi:outer membrane receptor protein involved in Fe transport